jgi:excisionase family DNA binding protein
MTKRTDRRGSGTLISPNRCKILEMPKQSNKPVDQPGLDELISLVEAADLCGLSSDHLRRLAREGELWGKKIGRNWVTTAQAVREYLARNRKPGPKPKDQL